MLSEFLIFGSILSYLFMVEGNNEFLKKNVFYRKLRNTFRVPHHISSIVWRGNHAKKLGWSLGFDEFEKTTVFYTNAYVI